ncbi:MAG: insulinase family protein [Deltaproteobacteria bacterium]|nr:insulinase family protein [Deltaproteobacteria bacterium]
MRRSGKNYTISINRVIYVFIMTFFVVSALSVDSLALNATIGAKKFILDNGLRVILKEDRSSPVVSIQVWVKAGSANETEEEAGISHVIEHMFFKGTPTRGAGEIAHGIEVLGGDINAYTTSDRTVYKVEIASIHFEKALDILMDALQHSLFDSQELTREKEVILEEYRRSLDIPQRQFGLAMNELSYKVHPYRRPVIGYESTIKSFDRRAILEYMAKWYTCDNIVIVAVGDLDSEEALFRIKSLTRDLPPGSGRFQTRTVEPAQTYPRTIVLNERVQQLYMDILWHTVSLNHPHAPALDILEIILGYGKSSRLYNRLKMERNLVNEIFAYSNTRLDNGQFSVSAALNTENFEMVIEVVTEEINRVIREPVTQNELERAKRVVEAHFLFNMEDMKGQANSLAFFEVMAGDMKKADEYLESVHEISPEDIQHVAKKYLRPERICMGIMLPENDKMELTESRVMEYFSHFPAKKETATRQRASESNEAVKYTLQSGMRIIVKEDHRLPLVSLRMAMLGGTRLENEENSGISKFVSEMLLRGTDTRNASGIAETVESWPADLDSFSGRNSFGISAKFLRKDFYAGLKLLADIILNPSFPDAEIEKVRQDILAGIESKKESPFDQLSELFYKTLYTTHPYAFPASGNRQSIKEISRLDLLKWYKELALPSNLVLSVTGGVREEELVASAEELFRDFDGQDARIPGIAPESPLIMKREVHLEREGNQTHLMIGFLDVDLKSEANSIMDLVNTDLTGLGGRLFRELRDKRSLAYSVTSFRRPGLETGVFGVYLACDPAKIDVAKKAVLNELESLRNSGLTAQELEQAKNKLIGGHAIEYQTNGSKAMQMALDELYGLGFDYHDEYIKRIKMVSVKDVKRVVEKIIKPEQCVIATVGPTS